MIFILFQQNKTKTAIIPVICSGLLFHLFRFKCPKLKFCSMGACFAGGHLQEEILHAPPQLCILGNLPQASVKLFHLLLFAPDIYREADMHAQSMSSQERPPLDEALSDRPCHLQGYKIWNNQRILSPCFMSKKPGSLFVS